VEKELVQFCLNRYDQRSESAGEEIYVRNGAGEGILYDFWLVLAKWAYSENGELVDGCHESGNARPVSLTRWQRRRSAVAYFAEPCVNRRYQMATENVKLSCRWLPVAKSPEIGGKLLHQSSSTWRFSAMWIRYCESLSSAQTSTYVLVQIYISHSFCRRMRISVDKGVVWGLQSGVSCARRASNRWDWASTKSATLRPSHALR